MSLAISLVSESSDHSLICFDGEPTFEQITKRLERFGEELEYMHINQIANEDGELHKGELHDKICKFVNSFVYEGDD